MFIKLTGASLVEWIVVVVVVVATLGVAVMGIANTASAKGSDVKNWIGNLDVAP